MYASIFTLSMQKHRDGFAVDAFDLIVVDEFHHAAAKTYMSVIEHFQPKFLLGITATPDRLDGKDVYALCDGNVAYQMHFIEAIRRGWLAPFQYYGVFDDTDYSQIRWIGTKYDEEQAHGCSVARGACRDDLCGLGPAQADENDWLLLLDPAGGLFGCVFSQSGGKGAQFAFAHIGDVARGSHSTA